MKGEEETVIQMKKLSIHPGNERQTFLLAGAPACGHHLGGGFASHPPCSDR